MRASRRVVFLGILVGLGCQRHPRVCPEGTEQVNRKQGEAECRAKDGQTKLVSLHEGAPATRRQSCSYDKRGIAEGAFTAWHKSGKVWIQGQYRGGKKEGPWRQWDETGLKVAEGDYRDGTIVAGAPVAAPAQCELRKP